MPTSVVQFRVDNELKQNFSEIYARLGLDLPSAMRMFMKRSVLVRGVPFDMTISEMPMESEDGLDYADRVAEDTEERYNHREVFEKIRRYVSGR